MSVKISELPHAASLQVEDLFVINDNSGETSTTSSLSGGDLIPFIQSNLDLVPFDGGSVGMGFVPDRNNGSFQKYLLIGDATLYAPTNGSIGKRIVFWITAPSTNATLYLDEVILIPSDSAFTGSKVLTANKMYIIQLQHNGVYWMLEKILGGY